MDPVRIMWAVTFGRLLLVAVIACEGVAICSPPEDGTHCLTKEEKACVARQRIRDGGDLLEDGKVVEAIDVFSDAIRHSDLNGWAYLHRGFAHFTNRNLVKALEDYNKAVEIASTKHSLT